MILTNEDKNLLQSWGFRDEDFRQIEEAFSVTTYKLLDNDSKKISRKEAIDVLGREAYLSGIVRSAFHWSSVRENEKGQKVYFNSSNLFE